MANIVKPGRTYYMRPPEGNPAMAEWEKINKTGEVEEEEKPDTVQPGLTYWMRPPEGAQTEEGLMPGDAGYIDPHAGAMEEWRNIPYKQGTGAEYGPNTYSQGAGQLSPEGSAPMSGNLRRPVHKLKTLSGAAKKGAI